MLPVSHRLPLDRASSHHAKARLPLMIVQACTSIQTQVLGIGSDSISRIGASISDAPALSLLDHHHRVPCQSQPLDFPCRNHAV